jgi:AraC-like DNA-binding protein
MLPHVWIPSKESIQNDQQHSYVLHFDPKLFGEAFWEAKELQSFYKLLQLASKGIHCSEIDTRIIRQKFSAILKSNGLSSLMSLLDLWQYLESLAWSEGLSPFSKENSRQNHNPVIEKVIEHLLHHYHEEIRQPDLANMASMSISHFSRFFKKSTGFSFSDYLNKIRIDQACQRIRNTDLSISQIAYDVGYRNLSQFNLNFKKIYDMTPKAYQLECRRPNH